MALISLIFAEADSEHARVLAALLHKEGWEVSSGPTKEAVATLVLWSRHMQGQHISNARRSVTYVCFDGTGLPWYLWNARLIDLGKWPSVESDRSVDKLLVTLASQRTKASQQERVRRSDQPAWVLGGVIALLVLLFGLAVELNESADESAPRANESTPRDVVSVSEAVSLGPAPGAAPPPTDKTLASTSAREGLADDASAGETQAATAADDLRRLALRFATAGRFVEAAAFLDAAVELEPANEPLRREYLVVDALATNAVTAPAEIVSGATCFAFVHIGAKDLAKSVSRQLSGDQAQLCRDLIEMA